MATRRGATAVDCVHDEINLPWVPLVCVTRDGPACESEVAKLHVGGQKRSLAMSGPAPEPEGAAQPLGAESPAARTLGCRTLRPRQPKQCALSSGTSSCSSSAAGYNTRIDSE